MTKWRPEGWNNPNIRELFTDGDVIMATVISEKIITYELGADVILELLRNQPNSWDLNSTALQTFIKQIPKPKGRLVFIPDDDT